MKFEDFLKHYNNTQLIDSSTFTLFSNQPKDLRRQVRYWSKKGYLICLKKGVYVFNEDYRKKGLSNLFLANFLVSPSYISLEYALGFYGLIPEKVTVFTSITTKKTQRYNNSFGVFEYRSVKKGLFFGYRKDIEDSQPYFVALPEKALLDFFYFTKNPEGDFDEFDSFRFQNLEILNTKKIDFFSLRYNKKVRAMALAFIKFIKQNKRMYKVLK
jgi:hypothetical protein